MRLIGQNRVGTAQRHLRLDLVSKAIGWFDYMVERLFRIRAYWWPGY